MPDGRGVEVVSVVARRRRWTLGQKLALVGEVSRPGASVAAVADRRGLSRSLLFAWRRQVRVGTMPGVVRAEASPALVPVRVMEDKLLPPRPSPPKSLRDRGERPVDSTATIGVVLTNGRVLRVSDAIRPEMLGRLAAALGA